MSGRAEALPWRPGDDAIAAEVFRVLDRGDAKPPGKLIDRLPQFAASEVRRVVLLMFRAGTLVVDSGYPPRYRLS